MLPLRRHFLAAGLLAALAVAGCGRSTTPSTERTPVSESFKVKFETTKGDFTVEVYPKWAPIGAQRFHDLVTDGFFDRSKFFRVLPGFVVQFGLPADPAAAKTYPELMDEPVQQSNLKGTLTFAKSSAPNSRTTQLFINLADNPRLDSMGFSPFGMVTEGMNVVESLYSGYGEGAPSGNGPDQGQIRARGNSYLDAQFPQLDGITKAIIVQ